jgi:hypothetical protein
VPSATVQVAGGAPQELPLSFAAREVPAKEQYAPGEGPGLHGELAVALHDLVTVTIPAKGLVDAFGNTNGDALTVERAFPGT